MSPYPIDVRPPSPYDGSGLCEPDEPEEEPVKYDKEWVKRNYPEKFEENQ